MQKLSISLPGGVGDRKYPIGYVLTRMASNDDCDGEPYDQMVQAAEYIEMLEQRIEDQEVTLQKIRSSPAGKIVMDYL